jgi:hypothetical protein
MSFSDENIAQQIQNLKSMGGFKVVAREDYERTVGHMATDDEMPSGQIGTLALYDETAPEDYVFLGDDEDELWSRFAIAWHSDDALEEIIIGRDISEEEFTAAFDDVVSRIRSGAVREEAKQAFFAEVDDVAGRGFLTPEQVAEIKNFENLIDRR